MKVQLPLLGKAAGSYAGSIYQSYYGHTYVRSFPTLFHYPDTQDQQTTQAKFFDIQRIWLPVYNNMTLSIGKNQRKNKNPFNIFSKGIFKTLNPYENGRNFTPLRYFGLDPLNRVIPKTTYPILKYDEGILKLTFIMNRPYNLVSVRLNTTHLLALNRTRQSLYYKDATLNGGLNEFEFENTNDWHDGDQVLVYVALSADTWLGNFNLVSEWNER